MFKYFAPVILVLLGFGTMDAQRYRNPAQYLRQFNNQKRKADIKGLLYLEASIKREDPRRIVKYHEIVLEQLKESKREVERIGPYKNYEILQREYVEAFDMLVSAFENEFRAVEDLRDSMYSSYDALKNYYEVATDAEDKLFQASYKIEKAEDHFIKTHFIEFERDQELAQRYLDFDEISIHVRDMTLAFFRVEYEVEDLLAHIEDDQSDSIENDIVDIKNAIKLSEQDLVEYEDFEEYDLYEEVLAYLEDIKEEISVNLVPLAEQLQNKYLDEKEYNSAQKDLSRFVDRHSGRVEDFYDTRMDLILLYLPED